MVKRDALKYFFLYGSPLNGNIVANAPRINPRILNPNKLAFKAVRKLSVSLLGPFISRPKRIVLATIGIKNPNEILFSVCFQFFVNVLR